MAIDWSGNQDEILSDEEIEKILLAENVQLTQDVAPIQQLVQHEFYDRLGIAGKVIYFGLVFILVLCPIIKSVFPVLFSLE